MKHEGRWEDRESASGQADLFRIVCACGWASRWIWSRYEEQEIGEAFNAHQDGAGHG